MMPATNPPSLHAAAVLVLLGEAREAGVLTPERAQALIDAVAVASERAALLATLTTVEHAARTAFAPAREEAWKANVRGLLTRIRSLHVMISNGGEPPPAEAPAVDDDSADGEDTAPLPRPPLPPMGDDTPERVMRSKMIVDVGDEVIARIGTLATRHAMTPDAMLLRLVYSGLDIEEGTLRRTLGEGVEHAPAGSDR